MERSRVLIMAGGTGGHVFPGLAVAEELRERGLDVTWLGTRRGVEAQLVPARDFPIRFIEVSGLRGKKGVLGKVKAPWQLLKALWQALAVVRSVKPDVVLGLGGFASGPGGLAARLLGKPLVIHEQNAVAGTTNRLLAKVANRVLEAFPGSLPRGQHCGNPVRQDISSLPAPEQRLGDSLNASSEQVPALLVLGGSLGALAINNMIPACVARMPASLRPEIRHQTGRDHLEATRQAYADAGVCADTSAFIDDMAEAYGWADLVLCRAGALTVSELTAAGLASILIPFPFAIDDHQTVNGAWLVDHEAALLIQQDDLNEADLAALLSELFSDRPRLLSMAKAARALSRPQATAVVADVCQELIK
ncbi:MAG: undecaprenyldiphospho-muramoylpentapeptide beta-N-acetylglucosaminyltransferase [Porticoccaceae bacterium]|nr:undecaprenyldiphospho-muramoylpentapeptide beta-N-acetylglucosaminyltransferase [Porticoccaceae bacterium]